MNWNLERIKVLESARPMTPETNEGGQNALVKLVTPTALIIIDGDVMTTYLNADVEFGEEEANHNIDIALKQLNGKKIYHLTVPDPSTHITLQPGNYWNERFLAAKKGEALVIKSLAHRILANAFISTRKKLFPIRIFATESEALKWFDELRGQE